MSTPPLPLPRRAALTLPVPRVAGVERSHQFPAQAFDEMQRVVGRIRGERLPGLLQSGAQGLDPVIALRGRQRFPLPNSAAIRAIASTSPASRAFW